MSGQPPTRNSDRDPLGFDELVALFVAFSVIGAILWWSLGRRAETWIGQSGLLGRGMPAEQVGSGAIGQVPVGTASPVPSPAEIGVTAPLPPDASGAAIGVPETAVVGSAPAVAPGGAVVPVPAPVVPAPVVPVPVVPVAPGAATGSAPTSPPVSTPAAPAPVIAVPGAAPSAISFPDVPNSYWAYPFIAELSRRGMIAGVGDGSFQPDAPVNRAQYAALLSEVLSGPQQGKVPFNDIPAGFWAIQPIDEAVRAGFLKGYPDTSFKPDQPITKMQVLLSLANGFQLPKPADPNAAIQPFADRDQIPEWARPAIGAATQAGVVVNYPDVNQFRPNQPATRAEVAAMLYQALETRDQLPPVQSSYIVQP